MCDSQALIFHSYPCIANTGATQDLSNCPRTENISSYFLPWDVMEDNYRHRIVMQDPHGTYSIFSISLRLVCCRIGWFRTNQLHWNGAGGNSIGALITRRIDKRVIVCIIIFMYYYGLYYLRISFSFIINSQKWFVICFNHGLPCHVKNMARGTQVNKNRGRRHVPFYTISHLFA